MTPNLTALPPASASGGSLRRWLRRNSGVRVFVAAWLLVCGVGFAALGAYSTRAGTSGTPPARWPAESRLALASDRPTLVLIAHPRCPCTRATMGELERLMAQSAGPLRIYILFVQPTGTPAE